MNDRLSVVSVAGSADAPENELVFAYRLGFLLGSSGHVVACGGGAGVMEEVCRGAREAGGLTIGILPGTEASEGGRWLDIALPSGLGLGRNRVVALAGFCLVAVGGGNGTLSEIAHALQSGRPVCCYGRWEGIPGVSRAGTPEEAYAFVEECERRAGCEAPKTSKG